eukprot:TRINITY_DN1118_c1_g1_i1.p2 TRINITY_DN1118_c1_g1~~TRINITY_DN1118_c1_g1_i1.p2  ORF type:complete len:103 (+),score=28.55 TRINITY_DN1118_c1_g1_i1:350-658(+)
MSTNRKSIRVTSQQETAQEILSRGVSILSKSDPLITATMEDGVLIITGISEEHVEVTVMDLAEQLGIELLVTDLDSGVEYAAPRRSVGRAENRSQKKKKNKR